MGSPQTPEEKALNYELESAQIQAFTNLLKADRDDRLAQLTEDYAQGKFTEAEACLIYLAALDSWEQIKALESDLQGFDMKVKNYRQLVYRREDKP